MYTLTYQKTYFIHFCCLFLKSLKAFSASFMHRYLLRWRLTYAMVDPIISKKVGGGLCAFHLAEIQSTYCLYLQNVLELFHQILRL